MLTEEQRFTFDLEGYIVLPGVLEPDLVDRLQAHTAILEKDPDSLPGNERSLPGRPFAEVIDHRAVIDLLKSPYPTIRKSGGWKAPSSASAAVATKALVPTAVDPRSIRITIITPTTTRLTLACCA